MTTSSSATFRLSLKCLRAGHLLATNATTVHLHISTHLAIGGRHHYLARFVWLNHHVFLLLDHVFATTTIAVILVNAVAALDWLVNSTGNHHRNWLLTASLVAIVSTILLAAVDLRFGSSDHDDQNGSQADESDG